MDPKKLKNNQDLYEYLLCLNTVLKERGACELSKSVHLASEFACGSSPSEFLGEARIALTKVKNEHNSILSNQEEKELVAVIRQIEKAFRKVGDVLKD